MTLGGCAGVVLLRRRTRGVRSVLVGEAELEEPWWFEQVQGGQDGLLSGGDGRALGDAAVRGGHGDQVHAVHLVAGVAPGVAGQGFHLDDLGPQ